MPALALSPGRQCESRRGQAVTLVIKTLSGVHMFESLLTI